ncbi:MAG: hypothetical protein AB1564_14650 [Chloroflexota bacterium]
MNRTHKFLTVFALFALLTLAMAGPARAFDGRTGGDVVIAAGEVINDDLYVAAENFTLDGTVKGDVVATGAVITINGTVEGDLMAAGQVIVINGVVTDDARIAGAALVLGGNASIGDDLIAAGASLETEAGSTVGGELVVGSAQALLAGDVAGDVLAGTAALELRGSFGGDVKAYVDVTEDTESSPPLNMYMTNVPVTIPSVQPGLTVDDGASIAGNLDYTSYKDISIPTGVVGGKVTRSAPQVGVEALEVQPTPAQRATSWSLDLLRNIVTLLLFGFLLARLTPKFMQGAMAALQGKPWPSLGWGVVAWAAFWFVLLLGIFVTILGAVVFGFFTLCSVSGTIVGVGILAIFALILAFVLATAFLTKIMVGWAGGKWILGRFNPALAEHKVWPLVVGVVIVAVLIALPFVGWLFNLLVIFFGLGALWLFGREAMAARKAVG